MRKITADWILPMSGPAIKDGLISVDDDGTILAVSGPGEASTGDMEQYQGMIIPGFVNTHCHLELSHMKGLVKEGLGLISFIREVITRRNFDEDTILSAIAAADKEMYENGIQAVGDISNMTHTFRTKQGSPIRYYTFVEYFDMMDERQTEKFIAQYDEVYRSAPQDKKDNRSAVPHAPYTMSPALFAAVNSRNNPLSVVSIHNEETAAENEFFRTRSGSFIDFYRAIGIPLDDFAPLGKNSIFYASRHMDKGLRTLMVHNTMMTEEDILHGLETFDDIYWVTCPNANLYIENRLPDYDLFIKNNCTITVGTDSLTSNWQLSILEELKAIQKNNPHLDGQEMLRWATLNGARALRFDDSLGSIEAGKRPGLILLQQAGRPDTPDFMSARIKRII